MPVKSEPGRNRMVCTHGVSCRTHLLHVGSGGSANGRPPWLALPTIAVNLNKKKPW
jgi:hypothetical protein